MAMRAIMMLALATTPSFVQGGAVTVRVDANPTGSGSAEATTPVVESFTTLAAARQHIIATTVDGRLDTTDSNVCVKIGPGRYNEALQLDHPALSGVTWEGVPAEDGNLPIISGGVEVPVSLFEPWAEHKEIVVASLSGIGASDLGGMISGDAVTECQHDKVGLTLNGESMVVARWPNIDLDDPNTPDGWQWTHARVGDDDAIHYGFKSMNNVSDPDAARLLRWSEESNPWIHIYAEWDWADAYALVTNISEDADGYVNLEYDGAPACKPYARWMGVNLLCELDAPGEYYIDELTETLYLYPPTPLDASNDVVMLGYQPGAVVNITAAVENTTLANLDVREGRHAGIQVTGAKGVVIENVTVHEHGTNGIVVTNATNAVVRGNAVYEVGCSGIRATAGVTATLDKGGMLIEGNDVSRHARWKRTYQPGIFWGGVNNTFRNNNISVAPHNCMLGGGDFGDEFGGVETVFEGNTMADCTFETTDSGGFYTCGQGGYAFVNRGNVLRNNTFLRVKNTAGLGVQIASNQAIYFDDQMSDWLVTGNTFVECQVGTFTGGGRRNLITNNTYRNCGTVHYLNNQGMNWDNSTVYPQCDVVAPPGYDQGETVCSTGAATWMATEGPAAAEWAAKWPEMININSDFPGEPAYSSLSGNTYCGSLDGESYMLGCPDGMDKTCEYEAATWQFAISGNTYMEECP